MGRITVRTISVASRAASDCSFAMACCLSSSMPARACLTCSWARVRAWTDGLAAGLGRLLAASFLVLENLLAGFAEALLVIGGAGLGGSNIGARFFHRTLSAAAALGEHGSQRPVDEKRIKGVEGRQQDDRGHGSEQ